MVFAYTKELDVLNNYHIVIWLVKDSIVNDFLHILLVSLCQILHSQGRTSWCFDKPLSIWIFTDAFDQVVKVLLDYLVNCDKIFIIVVGYH